MHTRCESQRACVITASRSFKPGAKNAFGVACGEESKRTSSDAIQLFGLVTRGGWVMGLLLVKGSSDVRDRPSVIKRCPSPLLDEGCHSHSLWWPERRPKDAVMFFGVVSAVVSYRIDVCVHSMRARQAANGVGVLTRMRAHENCSWTTQGSVSAACARTPPSPALKSCP